MKKLIVFLLLLSCTVSVIAQNFPYGKILNYSSNDFEEAKYKFDKKNNQWMLAKHNGLQATANILSIVAGTGAADIKPDKDDYEITAQLSKEGEIAWIRVRYYDNEIHHKLLTFVADHGQNTLETTAGNVIKIQFESEGYPMTLEQVHHGTKSITTQTSTATAKILDNSYNSYVFTIYTNNEPWSTNMEKDQLKQAKREAKGKKQQSAADLM